MDAADIAKGLQQNNHLHKARVKNDKNTLLKIIHTVLFSLDSQVYTMQRFNLIPRSA